MHFPIRFSLAILTFLAGMYIVTCDDKCENGGTVQKGVYPICQCPNGFKGFNCSEQVLPCEGRPCQNGGKCVELRNGKFKCRCSRLFTGILCQRRVLPCDSGPCKNGGTCINVGLTCFKCKCNFGFKGSDCSKIVQPCEIKPCKNDGVCTNKNGTYHCTCKSGFGGIICDKKDGIYGSKILKGHSEWSRQLDKWLGGEKEWRLCYRATQHGWKASSFHDHCDNHKPTVTIIGVGRYIFGAYTDVAFGGSASYKKSENSFIFSIRNKDNLAPFKAKVYRNPNNAIYTRKSYGPTFGGGHDIYIKDNAHTSSGSYAYLGHTYKPPTGYVYNTLKTQTLLAGSKNFFPSEVEVFYLE